MNNLQKIGLALFLLGMTLWIATLFMNDYQLTGAVIEQQIADDSKKEALLEATAEMRSQVFGTQFEFVAHLTDHLEKTNAKIGAVFEIPESSIQQLVAKKQGNTFQLNWLDDLSIEGQNKTLLADKFKAYVEWMDGKDFENKDEIQSNLLASAKAVHKDLLREKGFPQYEIQSLRYSVTKKSSFGFLSQNRNTLALLCLILICGGGLVFILPKLWTTLPGIHNNGIYQNSATNKGWIGIGVGVFLISFYVMLYWFPEYITSWILLVDPLSIFLSGNEASQWFLYGTLYTLAMLVMGVRMYIKYRGNRYQMIRTTSVLFFQLSFAFTIPELLVRLNKPYFDFKNIWPLDYDFFFNWHISGLLENGTLGVFMLGWGIALVLIGVPVFTYFFGKRWYCSWVCGCGGLAETLGDPYRQLSDKSLKAWKIERWMIHSVLVFAVVMTGATIYTFFSGQYSVLGIDTGGIQRTYGFLIGSAFAGVVGTGFYPFMGSRVWCRFGCPLAAYLGFVQRFKSRFRITTNGGQCISCGNCSTYCEMGIDVRWYAQRGQNIVRSSCVGCGICSAVCPRGVLKLENGPEEGRIQENPIFLGKDGSVSLHSTLAD